MKREKLLMAGISFLGLMLVLGFAGSVAAHSDDGQDEDDHDMVHSGMESMSMMNMMEDHGDHDHNNNGGGNNHGNCPMMGSH